MFQVDGQVFRSRREVRILLEWACQKHAPCSAGCCWRFFDHPQNKTGEILPLFTCCWVSFGRWILPAVFCAWKCLSQTLRCLSLRLAPRKGQFVIPNWPLIKAFLVTCGYNGICMKHSRKNTVPNPDVTIERQPVEDVRPIKHGDFPMSYVSFQGGYTSLSKVVSPHHPQRWRVFLLRSTRSIRFSHM